MTRQEEIRQEALKAEKEEFPRCAGDKENIFHGVNSAYGLGFVDGALWMRSYNKSPWISVKNDLPCNHKELVEFNRLTNKYSTKFILVIDSNGCVQLTFMEYDKYSWIWDRWEVLYWMPIPELPIKL